MSLLQIIILALIQGFTEFLPVSSSAHLAIAPELLGWKEDQGPVFDLMAHFGTLFAVIIYFHNDLKKVVMGTRDLCKLKLNHSSALALNLIISSPPVLVIGFLLNKYGLDVGLRFIPIIAFTTIVFGVLLWFSDVRCDITITQGKGCSGFNSCGSGHLSTIKTYPPSRSTESKCAVWSTSHLLM